jgi:hypothetical protein
VLLAAIAVPGAAQQSAAQRLGRTLSADIGSAARTSGADVLDLTTGSTVFSSNARIGRLSASVEKDDGHGAAAFRSGRDAPDIGAGRRHD